MDQLTFRQTKVFKTIVDEFIRTAEPVGSKTLLTLLDFNCSSATLRNEMAALEEMGLLEKTHTSSGRIPSSKGYRYYVDNLMEKQLDQKVVNALQTVFDARNMSIDEVVRQSCDILSQMTNLTSVVLGPESRYQTLQHISLIPINERSAVAIFITNHGHTENKTFRNDPQTENCGIVSGGFSVTVNCFGKMRDRYYAAGVWISFSKSSSHIGR